MTSNPDIAFIGLGAMGFGMATNLVRRGYKVAGFDVWAPTLAKFEAEGGLAVTTVKEAVEGKEYCICMVANAQQAQEVLIDGASAAIKSLPKGAAILLCSTVSPSYVQGLQHQLVALGRGDITLVDAPVSGGTYRAADGTLSIMAGGSNEALDKVQFLLREMSDPKKLYIVEGGVGAGSKMKMVHQILAAIQVLATSEAMGFADYLGLDLSRTADMVLRSQGWSWMFENRSPRLLQPDQPVASALTIILKDIGIITAEARSNGFPSLLSSTAEQVYLSALGKGYGSDDDSSMIRLYTEGKGAAIGSVAGTGDEGRKLAMVVALLKAIHLCSAAEALAFSTRLGLDLNQVFDLCVTAAGGSYMFESVGPRMLGLLAGKDNPATQGSESLLDLSVELEATISEAQRLRVPTYLGSQALNMIRLALSNSQKTAAETTLEEIVRVWGY